MIPGMYAYGTVQALISYLQQHEDPITAPRYLDLLIYNGTMTLLIILMLVVGVTVPKTLGLSR